MKRRLFKLALFLILGAIVNVAVAWGCAKWIKLDYRVNTTGSSSGYPYGEDIAVVIMQSKGAMLIKSNLTIDWDSIEKRWVPFNPRSEMSEMSEMSERTKAAIDISARYKFVHPSHANLQEMKGVIRVLTAHGWPRLALWSGYEIGYGGDGPSSKPRGYWTIWSGMRISGTQHDYSVGLNAVPRSLPYRPIWSGFAINTLFYAAILWILWSSSSAARRLIRRKRELCIKCGYDLRGNFGGDVCPECGNTITAPK